MQLGVCIGSTGSIDYIVGAFWLYDIGYKVPCLRCFFWFRGVGQYSTRETIQSSYCIDPFGEKPLSP